MEMQFYREHDERDKQTFVKEQHGKPAGAVASCFNQKKRNLPFLHSLHVIHVWCSGTLKLESLMCEKKKKKERLPESVEKGVMPLLLHVCCACMCLYGCACASSVS